MEREPRSTMLLMFFGGGVLQVLAQGPTGLPPLADVEALEQAAWFRVCLPALPLPLIAAWLAGWALTQPDPVRTPLDPVVVVALWLPFGLLFLRALLRAAWAPVSSHAAPPGAVRDSRMGAAPRAPAARGGVGAPAGPHTVVFRHAEKGIQTRSVTVKPGETIQPVAGQHFPHRRGRNPEPVADTGRTQLVSLPFRHDPGLDLGRSLMRTRPGT